MPDSGPSEPEEGREPSSRLSKSARRRRLEDSIDEMEMLSEQLSSRQRQQVMRSAMVMLSAIAIALLGYVLQNSAVIYRYLGDLTGRDFSLVFLGFLVGGLLLFVFGALLFIAYYLRYQDQEASLRMRSRDLNRELRRLADLTVEQDEDQDEQEEVPPGNDYSESQPALTNAEAPASVARLGLPEPPDDLIRACAAGECVLYAGSGLSAQAGLPTWEPFVAGLLDRSVQVGVIHKPVADSLREALAHGEAASVADEIVSEIGEQSAVLIDYLRQVFTPALPQLPRTHEILSRLPFSAVLTTNFDKLVELAFGSNQPPVYTPGDYEPLLAALSRRDFFITKLYGTLDKPETVLVAPAQYQVAVAENLLFAQFMESLFFSRTLFFVGASLNGIAAYLNGLKFRGTGNPQHQHYALVDVTGSGWQTVANGLRRRYNINVLPYTASANYSELPEFLQRFSERVELAGSSQQVPVGVTGRSPRLPTVRLGRLHLENVGPFDRQSFVLDQYWNVLLGDNGVGKSSVLKAIAVGLSGESARPFADRLIRSRSTSGTITIELTSDNGAETITRTYVTKLLRTEDGAEIQTIPTRPLEAEGLLALGFPPLRPLSWNRPTESPGLAQDRPVPADLLPLVSGDPDPRIDGLKTWLIDLDHRIQRDLNEGRTESRYLKLRDAFYDALRQLTRGLTLARGTIDIERRLVTVITDDGEVPIEALSQGTASLLGWIGVLLRRLYDVYSDQANPAEQSALVLIDEIDAHLHPEWQRTLAFTFRTLFPNVQVVATTHSPLIAASAPPNTVLRLRRDESDRKKVSVEKPKLDLRRWRADQILTSPLFDLPSTLSPEIFQAMQRYTELTAHDNPSLEEEREIERCAALLQIRPPTPLETQLARDAFEQIEQVLDDKIQEMPPERRRQLLEEVRAQVQENVTGSRRPL